jgi:alpha-L-rhamnosidase
VTPPNHHAVQPPTLPAACEIRAEYLRCEFRIDPLGIDEPNPRLSWEATADVRGATESGYRVLVASSPDRLAADVGDLWDSGRCVRGLRETSIAYGGTPLRSHQRCWWKLQLWDGRGRASRWSDAATWSHGLVSATQWRGEWIGHDVEHVPDDEGVVVTPARLLRGLVRLEKPIRSATLYATAMGIADLHVNGTRVSDDRFLPGWTDYAKRVYYRGYDVTALLGVGDNAWGAMLADGWFAGYIGPDRRRDHYGSQPRFSGHLHVEYADGSCDDFGTDASWRAGVGATLATDFQMGETVDATQDVAGWCDRSFDADGWSPVSVGGQGLSPAISAHPGPAVIEIARFHPLCLTEPSDGGYVLDLGQNFAGVVRLTIRSPKRGQRIALRFAERLNDDGTLYTTNLRGARCADVYVCHGRGGDEVFEPRFTFHGFQYVEIRGLDAAPRAGDVVGVAIGSDTPQVGRFGCSDPMLNQLWSNIYWTQRSNFLDIPTDCPQRDERLGWTGDAQIYVRTAALNCDVQAFFAKWLVDLLDAQRDDGQFPMVAPVKIVPPDGGPAWADAGVICPWTLYDVYGDERLLRRCYPAMKRFVAFCHGRCTPELRPPEKYHCFGDWLQIDAKTDRDVIFTAYFAHSTHLLALAAEALGESDDAARYHALYREIAAAFRRDYLDPDGRVRGDTQAGYVLAIAFGLVEGEQLRQAADHLVADIERRGGHLTTGFVGTKDLMLALARAGRNDVAYRLLLNDTFPSWGFSIRHGATSIWERWDGWTPEKGFQDPAMNSFAHYSFGAVYQWMVENIGGLRNREAGFGAIDVTPLPDDRLTSAHVAFRSPRGWIETRWDRDPAGGFTLEVVVPVGATAQVRLPATERSLVTESSRLLAESVGVTRVTRGADAALVSVGSGRYHFHVAASDHRPVAITPPRLAPAVAARQD